jgi:hypothetical protein
MTLEIGDRVNYVSDNHGQSPANPLVGTRFECSGTVLNVIMGGDSINVEWDNGTHNSYSNRDLVLASGNGGAEPNRAFRLKKHKRR